jgi:RNA polymerase sigma-70 factor (ECF subfamily)
VTVALLDLERSSDAAAPADLAEGRLLAGLRRGDARAFETLYRRQSGAVYGLAYHLTGRPADAEELTQEVFVRAWQHRAGFRSLEHFGRWLKRVAVNLWINGLRRRQVAERPGDDDAEPRDAADGAPIAPAGAPGLKLDLERALAALTPRLRAVLLLFDLYGLRHEEIAEALDITPGASKVQLHRARSRLREILR